MTKCGNSLTLLGDFVVDRVNHKGELCAQDCYKGSSEWRTLCSWPRREKVLLVNNVPVVYFGRTNDNKPIYWSPSAEVQLAGGNLAYNRYYDWILTGEAVESSGGHWERVLFYEVKSSGTDPFTNFYLIRKDNYISGKIVGNVYQDIFVTDFGGAPSFGGFTSSDLFQSDGRTHSVSVWRDEAGNPLTEWLQSRVAPPEHKSKYRASIKDGLHYGMKIENGKIFDSVWLSFSGHGVMTRVNGTQVFYGGDAVCKAVDFVVRIESGVLVVDADVHVTSSRRKVFDYLDVLEQEVVSGITCEVKDCEED